MKQDEIKKAALIEALQEDLQRKSNELFRYALQSSPYVPRGDEFFLEAYDRLAPIDDDNAESLTAAIRMLDGTPMPGVWDLGLADMNYLHVRFLNRRLAELLRDTIRQVEHHLPLAKGFPKIEAILQTVLEDTRFQLDQLEALQDRPGEAEFAPEKKAAKETETDTKKDTKEAANA